MSVTLTVLGSGDAFGTGGRFQTCLALRGGPATILIDCGASSLIAMKRSWSVSADRKLVRRSCCR